MYRKHRMMFDRHNLIRYHVGVPEKAHLVEKDALQELAFSMFRCQDCGATYALDPDQLQSMPFAMAACYKGQVRASLWEWLCGSANILDQSHAEIDRLKMAAVEEDTDADLSISAP